MARKPGFYFSTEKQIAKIRERQSRQRIQEKAYKRTQRLITNISKRAQFSSRTQLIGQANYRTVLHMIIKPKPVYNKSGNVIRIKYLKSELKKVEQISKLSKKRKSATFILRRYLKHTEDYKELKKTLGYKPKAFEIIDPERARARDEWYREHEMLLKAASIKKQKGEITYAGYLKETAKAQASLCDDYGICLRQNEKIN